MHSGSLNELQVISVHPPFKVQCSFPFEVPCSFPPATKILCSFSRPATDSDINCSLKLSYKSGFYFSLNIDKRFV